MNDELYSGFCMETFDQGSYNYPLFLQQKYQYMSKETLGNSTKNNVIIYFVRCLVICFRV